MLGEHRDVRVVVDEDREPQALGHDVAERHVTDRQVDRRDRDGPLVVEEGGMPNPTARTSPPTAARASSTTDATASITALRSLAGARR